MRKGTLPSFRHRLERRFPYVKLKLNEKIVKILPWLYLSYDDMQHESQNLSNTFSQCKQRASGLDNMVARFFRGDM